MLNLRIIYLNIYSENDGGLLCELMTTMHDDDIRQRQHATMHDAVHSQARQTTHSQFRRTTQ